MDRLETYTDPSLTRQDLLVLKSLLNDIDRAKLPSINGCGTSTSRKKQNGVEPRGRSLNGHGPNGAQRHSTNSPKAADGAPASGAQVNGVDCTDESIIKTLDAINDPSNADFEPTVFFTWDLKDLKLPSFVNDYLLQPYIRAATKLVRVETDVVVLTHLILYFTTSVPSALFLYYRFHWLHGIAHWLMQAWYVGTYTLMMHQHIHMNGVLARSCWLFDGLFPYITNPLMGHTWNSYYYHHVKHHHVEGNGPGDLSSTIYYQRDDPFHFLCYLGRFFFFAWLELPLYFVRKGKPVFAAKAAFWELSNYLAMYILARLNWRPTLFVFILPFVVLRVALMVGNWGQHALVDEIEPDSDFRSSITLIDVTSNRFCYNDGYHTSHHLNPRRHWREHPVAFLKQKDRYSAEHALVFRNIDYFMMTFKLLTKDYLHLAKCLVPIGDQIGMSLEELAAMLRTKTRQFTKEEIQKKFGQPSASQDI